MFASSWESVTNSLLGVDFFVDVEEVHLSRALYFFLPDVLKSMITSHSFSFYVNVVNVCKCFECDIG